MSPFRASGSWFTDMVNTFIPSPLKETGPMPEPSTHSVEDVMHAVTELRQTVDDYKAAGREPTAEQKQIMERCEVVLDAHEDMNQRVTAGEAKAKENADAILNLKDDLDAAEASSATERKAFEQLEAEIARRGGVTPELDRDAWKADNDEYKAHNSWARFGTNALPIEQRQLLRTDSAVSGGVLVTQEMETFITKQIIEMDAFRSVARVRRINGKSIVLPIRTAIPTASWEGEAEAGPDTVGAYNSETLTPFRQHTAVPITQDMLQDGAFDMESEVSQDASESFALGEGQGFINGTGFKEPQGILQNTLVGGINSGAAGIVDPVDLLNLIGNLKTGYGGTFLFNRTLLAELRTFRVGAGGDDNVGPFMWAPGADGGAANTFAGFPYKIMPTMPASTTGLKAVAFGDFARGYVIVDRTGLSVVRDDVTQAANAIIKFTFNRWLTGQVVLAEAIKVITVA